MTTPDRQIRWLSCRNNHTTTAPPFAIMSLSKSILIDQQHVWGVTQPMIIADYGATLGFPTTNWYAANGPTPIEPGGYGKCTQDYPMRVSLISAGGGIIGGHGRFDNVGPVDASWHVSINKPAFEIVNIDYANPIGEELPDDWAPGDAVAGKLYTVWVAPLRRFRPSGAAVSYPPIGGVSPFTQASGEFFVLAGRYLLPEDAESVRITDDNLGLECQLDGLFTFGCQASLHSSEADDGDLLRYDIQVDGVNTGFFGFRAQHTGYAGGYAGMPTSENVAVTGLLNLTAGQIVAVCNTSAFDLSVGGFQFWACRLGGVKPTVHE